MSQSIEDLQAELEEMRGVVESLSSNNKKLTAELRNTRMKVQDVDIDLYHKTIDEHEALKANFEKLQKQHKADLDKLSNELSSKDAYLQKTLIDDNLTKTLLEAGIKKEQIEPAKAMLKNDVKLQLDGTDYKAIISDKALNEYVPEWTKTQTWLNLGTPDAGVNTGGKGAEGKPTVKKSKGEMTASEKAQFITEHGQDAYLKLN